MGRGAAGNPLASGVAVSKSIFGELSAEMPDGTVLTAPNDLLLAWKVAEYSYGSTWETMRRTDQYIEVAEVLDTLRAAYDEHETDDDCSLCGEAGCDGFCDGNM